LIKVSVLEGESIDKVLKRFKKKYEKAGILKEVRKRGAYIKPSVRRRMKKAKAIRRSKRNQAEDTV
jgi:small subunit ribosomal protein S21